MKLNVKFTKNSNIEGEICVDVAKGCALLINSDIWKNGKFDERYFFLGGNWFV